MEHSPKISVLMPVYNGQKYLKASIDSILGQTFEAFEFLIMDDGSNDTTPEILEEYAKKDYRIRLFRQKNQGIVKSLNKLIDLSKTAIIARMDADDIAYPERFMLQYDYLRKRPKAVLVACLCRTIIEKEFLSAKSKWDRARQYWAYVSGASVLVRSFTHVAFFEDFMNRWFLSQNPPFIHSAVMLRKDALVKSGKYEQRWYPAEDYALWIKLKRLGKIVTINKVLMDYKVRSDGISGLHFLRQLQVRNQLNNLNFEDIYKQREIPTVVQIKAYSNKYGFSRLQKRLIAKLCCATGCFYVKKNLRKKATLFFRYSMRLDWRRIDSLVNLVLGIFGRAALISIDTNSLIKKRSIKLHWFRCEREVFSCAL